LAIAAIVSLLIRAPHVAEQSAPVETAPEPA